jgi:hypothetical protein
MAKKGGEELEERHGIRRGPFTPHAREPEEAPVSEPRKENTHLFIC